MPKPLRKSPTVAPRVGRKKLRTSVLGDATPHRLRAFQVGKGLPSIPDMVQELDDMTDVLMGRVAPPIDDPLMGLHEVADMYYARAAEMTRLLQQMEREGYSRKGSAHYQFRNGELRTFMEKAKRAADLGSRRVSAERLRFDQEQTGRESKGFQ